MSVFPLAAAPAARTMTADLLLYPPSLMDHLEQIEPMDAQIAKPVDMKKGKLEDVTAAFEDQFEGLKLNQ